MACHLVQDPLVTAIEAEALDMAKILLAAGFPVTLNVRPHHFCFNSCLECNCMNAC